LIISRCFPSDDNDLLKDVQHDLYLESVDRLFDAARKALVRADEILGTQLLIVEQAKAIDRFDHRVLQGAHDILAATYRHRDDDGGQLRLLEPPEVLRSRYSMAWQQWLNAQLDELAKLHGFVRSTVQAVLLANTELGYVAERELCALLVSRYDLSSWEGPGGYAAVYATRV
jgi:hypothetical protein